MKYYGIVSKIKDHHKTGIYGRKKITPKEYNTLKERFSDSDWLDLISYAAPVIPTYGPIVSGIIQGGKKIYNQFKNDPILFLYEMESKHKRLVIPEYLLQGKYQIGDEFSYGLFDELSLSDKIFKLFMKSKGGAELNIYQRDDLPSVFKHIGGEEGRFSEGIYIGHPKDESLLIPLNNSNALIQSLILEETIRAYEALGAKSIKIHDLTDSNAEIGGKNGKMEANVSGEAHKEVLRKKTFGKGTFDPERAKRDKLLIFDIPAVKSTIDGRIEGNQLTEEFTEDINLSVGLDVNILELFKANSNFNYQRKWSFDVEFYDKNELT